MPHVPREEYKWQKEVLQSEKFDLKLNIHALGSARMEEFVNVGDVGIWGRSTRWPEHRDTAKLRANPRVGWLLLGEKSDTKRQELKSNLL